MEVMETKLLSSASCLNFNPFVPQVSWEMQSLSVNFPCILQTVALTQALANLHPPHPLPLVSLLLTFELSHHHMVVVGVPCGCCGCPFRHYQRTPHKILLTLPDEAWGGPQP